MLPKNEKRNVVKSSRVKLWIYGAPYAGKTTLADQFNNVVMLNTDGNINSFTSPVVEIKERVEGRQIISGWDVLNETINELQKGQHDFETIVIDLIEDTFEMCRRWAYKKLDIEHESDNSFKAWDYVRNEFLTTLKRLTTLPYNIILISHEDMSKDITKKSGDKITSIRPNIQEKLANKIAGMVDITCRVVADGEKRYLYLGADDVIFGGGRLKTNVEKLPLNYKSVMSLYGVTETEKQEQEQAETVKDAVQVETVQVEEVKQEPQVQQQVQAPTRRRSTRV